MAKPKKTKKPESKAGKTTAKVEKNSDTQCVVWTFDKIDSSGEYAFDVDKIEHDGNLNIILKRMTEFSKITWADIKKQTHSRSNHTCHHYLDGDGLSKTALERINTMGYDYDIDSIFSFRFESTLRIIGIRENEVFHVVWYDPNHKFYPSKKKNT